MWGTRLSLAVGVAAALIAAVIGSAIGIVAGYYGGHTDNLFMRGVDMLMAFPYILLALAIVAALGPGLMNALIAVAAVNVPFFARNIRGVTVGLAGREFIDAARLSGMGHARIILTELLPNVLPVIVIAMSTTVGWMILETAGPELPRAGQPAARGRSGLDAGRGALGADLAPAYLGGAGDHDLPDRDVDQPSGRRGARRARPPAALGRADAPAADHAGRAQAGTIPAPTDDLLAIQDLQTQFHVGKRIYRAVGGVSLAVRPGECLGLIGESGSGKSVTALSVMGLVASPPGVITGGAVRFQGEDLVGAPYETLRKSAATVSPISSRTRCRRCTRSTRGRPTGRGDPVASPGFRQRGAGGARSSC